MLSAVDLDEDFVDVKGVAVASVLSLQPTSVDGAKLDTPKLNRFAADNDAPFSE